MITPLYIPELDRREITVAQGALPYDRVIGLLDSSELSNQITQGNVTVAMIRPNLSGNTRTYDSDTQIADTIEAHIMRLGVITKFAIQFDHDAVNSFYSGDPKVVQLALPPERLKEHPNRWTEFAELMVSGPSTVLLLYSLGHDAISLWRNQVGHYDIVNRRDMKTIRGQFGHGKDNYNNLIHGSDSPEAAACEVAILKELLLRTGNSNASIPTRN